MVIWLIGMSASGKTTIGKKLHNQLELSGEKWVFIDGDVFRHILGEDLGHSFQERRKNAYRISRFCEFLSIQGVNVLACVLSIFHDNQEYNRINIPNYKEVFIDVDFNELIKRDNKELYNKALQGDIKNVVGVDIEFKPPLSPDLTIDNNAKNPNFEEIAEKIINGLNIKLERKYKYTKISLLENPHKYEYSKFEGEQFFARHQKDRKDTINFLEKRSSYLNYEIKLEKLKYSNHLNDKNLILKNFLIYLLQNNNELNNQKDIILTLIKRFEVGKKLYLTYDMRRYEKVHQNIKIILTMLFSH